MESDIVSAKGGMVRYVITSEGLFSISVVTDEAYQILTGKKPGKPEKKDLLLTLDSKSNSYEGKI